MPRRPLVATVVTTVAGALFGAILGALVGRVIALFGDETVQVSVPMVFCGTLGYFVGGASAAKGSLDRFGAKRSGLGAFVAVLVLIAIVGGASLSHTPGVVIAGLGVVAAIVAAAVATLVAGAQAAPVQRGGVPQQVSPPRKGEAAPQEQAEAQFVATPAPTPRVEARPAVRRVPVAEVEPEAESEPAASVLLDEPNWSLSEAPEPSASSRPRRDRPLRRDDAAPAPAAARTPAKKPAPVKKAATAKKAPATKAAKPKITPPPAPRQARGRSPRKGTQ